MSFLNNVRLSFVNKFLFTECIINEESDIDDLKLQLKILK